MTAYTDNNAPHVLTWKATWQSKWNVSFRNIPVEINAITLIADIRMNNGLVVKFVDDPRDTVFQAYVSHAEAAFQRMVWVLDVSQDKIDYTPSTPFSNIKWANAPLITTNFTRPFFIDMGVPNEIYLVRYLSLSSTGKYMHGYGSTYTHFDLVNNDVKSSQLHSVLWKEDSKRELQTLA